MAETIVPVILSGGSGTRLWPLSRTSYPKQFISLDPSTDESFLQSTARRVENRDIFSAPVVVCNEEHRFIVSDQLATCGVTPERLILEPVPRNTAPAIAVAALHVAERQPDAVIAVLPSDHAIADLDAFVAGLKLAAEIASSGRIVTFGITPACAETGYGYIEIGPALSGVSGAAHEVAAFREKPDRPTAERWAAGGRHYWNSGIFVFTADALLTQLERLQPDILAAAKLALQNAETDLSFLRLDAQAFARAPAISVDYAIMENIAHAAVVPLDAGWSDIGSWAALWQWREKDGDGNAVSGAAILHEVTNSYIHSDRSIVAALGVDNLVVVDTADALLVMDRDRAQDVPELIQQLREAKRPELDAHVMSYRPWGHYETLNSGERFQVKHLRVNPGGKLSMQMHHHRSEHWVVVRGTARVTRGNEELFVNENESVYISPTEWHRLENPGKVPLDIIEVQIGTYLGEDDIIRADDIYRRP